MSSDRPNPEELLASIKKEESQENKGRLKIFFGMCAGVGKTCSMLEAAQQLKRAGVDVAIGTIATHSRAETAFKVEGLKVIPEQTVDYKGNFFKELDLDAIIKEHPQVVLVDELAHTNIPGLRHAKRWQDVLEILENGIDVYTTLNVQHVDSLNDTVKGITDIGVRETVPDSVVEQAASIQLVDLTPDELLERLKEGKVYLGEQSRVATLNFFQKDKLAALREIALRYAAEKVDRDLRRSVPTSEKTVEWKPREKFLVAVSPSPHSIKLIRTARRLATSIDAPWVAIYINTDQTLSEEENRQLAHNLRLARELGAEVRTVNDLDVAEGIKTFARQKGVTQIILGRTPKSSFLNFFRYASLLDKLSAECSDVDIHVIRQDLFYVKPHRNQPLWPSISTLIPYVMTFLCVCLLVGFNWLILPYTGYKVIGVLFLIYILLLSQFFKKGPIIFASVLYALAWDYFFIHPFGEFEIATYEDTALLVLYVLTAITMGYLVDRARDNKLLLEKNMATTQKLYDLGEQMVKASSEEEVFEAIEEQLAKTLGGEFKIILKEEGEELSFEETSELVDNDYEKGVGLWASTKGKEAGWSTDTLPAAKNLYIPLKGYHGLEGLLIFRPAPNKNLSVEEKNFLYAVIAQLNSYL